MSYAAKTNWQLNEIVMPTDMNRIEQGIKDLDDQKLAKEATSVSSGTNLNTCTEIGTYTWSSVDSTGIGNCPELNAQAVMFVVSGLLTNPTNLTQIVITQNNRMYIRQLIDSVWGNWSDGPNNFDGIKKYNLLSATAGSLSPESLTVNPIPTSWMPMSDTDPSYESYQSGGYEIFSAGTSTYLAFDGKADTYWGLETQTSAHITLKVPAPIKVNKVKIRLEVTGTGASGFQILGSVDGGGEWATLYSNGGTNMPNTLTEINLSTKMAYKFYRIYFTVSDETNLKSFKLYEFQFSDYILPASQVNYTISNISFTHWNSNQILLAETPKNYVSAGVTANTLNGLPVDVILESGRRYELLYLGTSFKVKEVG